MEAKETIVMQKRLAIKRIHALLKHIKRDTPAIIAEAEKVIQTRYFNEGATAIQDLKNFLWIFNARHLVGALHDVIPNVWYEENKEAVINDAILCGTIIHDRTRSISDINKDLFLGILRRQEAAPLFINTLGDLWEEKSLDVTYYIHRESTIVNTAVSWADITVAAVTKEPALQDLVDARGRKVMSKEYLRQIHLAESADERHILRLQEASSVLDTF